ncbi:alpha-1A adrenergic receptor-like [Gigantopelta aegis]|uniref:alpha-1A adrenergic receptor-like n=1 Tax=Gigantopelta aegis TaxID=1735272 RepID=UPI001B88BEF7|nr:alpha-1A adrenergic receptor-like [Gigantopelta aegis]
MYEGAEYYKVLAKLNYERMLFQLPVIITLLVVMVMAIFGNILVICVYRLSCKRSVASFFIIVLAIVDLTTALCTAFNIQDMLNPYMNPAPVACKIGRFLESFTAVLSGIFLVCIAFDRYFHIIYPLRGYTLAQAKYLAIVMSAVALSLAWPQLFLAGKKTVKTSVEGIFGEDCSFQDSVYNSIYTLLFQGMLAVAFFTGISMTVFFYSRIYYVIWRRRKQVIGEQISTVSSQLKHLKKKNQFSDIHLEDRRLSSCRSKTELSTEINTPDEVETGNHHRIDRDAIKEETCLSDQPSVTPSSTQGLKNTVKESTLKGEAKKSSRKRRIGTVRITRIMTAVTLAGMLGYMPYLLVNIFKNMGLFFKPGMSKTEDLVYEFGTKSHFMNTFVNPVIYSVMNPDFRVDAWRILTNVGRIRCNRERF